jgi:hypothetical protein
VPLQVSGFSFLEGFARVLEAARVPLRGYQTSSE